MSILEDAFRKGAGRYRIRPYLSLSSENRIEASFHLPGAFPGRRKVANPEKHCLMRAFDKMFIQGDPTTGRIGALMLYDPARGGCRCLASFALTHCRRERGILGGHRLVLFPSWKMTSNTIEFKDSSGTTKLFNAHHVTFEPNTDGTVNCHATRLNGNDKLKLSSRLKAEDNRIPLCQVLIQDHRSLDPVGLIKRSIAWESDPEQTIRIWRESLHENFPDRHILMIPPDLINKSEYGVVLVKMYLSNSKMDPPSEGRFPGIVFSTLPSRATEGLSPSKRFVIKIQEGLYLSIAVLRLDGVLPSKVTWTFEK